jgi:hypothetical protein
MGNTVRVRFHQHRHNIKQKRDAHLPLVAHFVLRWCWKQTPFGLSPSVAGQRGGGLTGRGPCSPSV